MHRAEEFLDRIRGEAWLTGAVQAVRASGLPGAWIGAGVLRDVIWGQLSGGFDPATVHDVDVAFFDPADLGRERDKAATAQLNDLLDVPWEATNQAAVHTWYHHYFGGPPVAAFTSVHDAVSTWPETATCVAIHATPKGIGVCAPYGLDDLLDGTWRRNPARVSYNHSEARLARQHVAHRWPTVTVVPPTPS